MAEYSEKVNDWNFEDWIFVGKEFEERRQGRYSDENPEGILQDDYYPMMLYAYPLKSKPTEEEIKEIHENTSTTVVKKRETGKYYLALTGGGMDFSQDIALAYLITDGYIPPSLAKEVNTQEGLTQRGENFKRVMKGCKKSLENNRRQADWKIEDIEDSLSEEK